LKKNTKIKKEKVDKALVDLEVDLFVLKPTTFLVLPETPNIYLSEIKTKKLIENLKKALPGAKDGVIIRLKGDINPKEEKKGTDGSMFLSREIAVEKLEDKWE